MFWFIPLVIFLAVAIFSPGPNNVIAMSVGFNNGFKRVIPHLLAVVVGFSIMLFVVGIGIKELILKYQSAFEVMKYLCSFYLLYLAYKIATSKPNLNTNEAKPITFKESLLFQVINPKSWIAALSIVTIYLPKDNFLAALFITIIISDILIILAISAWAVLGKSFNKIFKSEKTTKIFNFSMAILLVVSVLMILFVE
ncbi:LysE family translocator [Caminibacter pacificus]